ncbi:tRNA (guanosine(46)-N7)-methyltransferase TrmB [uncultured Tyzzerella sp.]|uniref:tRNA (guanosine(46)-N7)-methyltransferase TrmB n=1 Tax=uncultured Tyzzerella sp. TaxID=2321398 RepID=UPI002943C84E|nr:tRNA (guanosine(46)-N7)-methyltransferase TrmB [uncultured Tyzzerella sp.]
MRLRKKPWGDNELNTNDRFIHKPEENKGKWREVFGNDNPIHIEIGTGKGQFLTTMSLLNPNINYIAIERQTNVIVSALKKGREKGVGKNIVFFVADVKELLNYFEPEEIDRIYINFCDPWPNKKKWAKRRLTHKNFLNLYEALFTNGGEVFFKTDNRLLFEFSLNEFADKGWRLHNISLDLHNSDFEGNVKTEYEEKFSGIGMPIYRLEGYYKK